MKTHPLLATCLVLGSSSAAMADSFHFQARATANLGDGFHAGVVVRDHRVAPPSYWVSHGGAEIPHSRAPAVALPPLTGPTWDCHNWDPTVEVSSVCAAYASGRPELAPGISGGVLLGVRDAAVPDHQYITVDDGRAFRTILVEGNDCAPEISRVAIRFMDGSTQVVNTGATLRAGRSLSIALDGGYRKINQILFYTPSGARGSYAVLAR